MSRAMKH